MKENLNYKRISLVLLILVIILFITQMCNNTDRLQGQYDILKKQLSGVKVLGFGKLEKKLTVKANAFSSKAFEEIEKLGGKAEVI